MNYGMIARITKKDMAQTVREPFFIFFIVFPLIMALILNISLGSLGGTQPSLAILGDDDVYSAFDALQGVDVSRAYDIEELTAKLVSGTYDAGLVAGDAPSLLFSGSSLPNVRASLYAISASVLADLDGTPSAARIEQTILQEEGLSLQVRLIPFLVIIAAVIGGLIISSSLIEEREQGTMSAMFVSPATPLEIISAKALFGLFLGMVMGMLILLLNNALTDALILVFLLFGVLFTVGLGLIAGVIMDNITDLVARMKLFNIFLQLPALVILFQQIPQWVGMLFPTYYFIDPILSITQYGAGIGDVWWKLLVLIACDAAVLALAARVLRQRMLGVPIRH